MSVTELHEDKFTENEQRTYILKWETRQKASVLFIKKCGPEEGSHGGVTHNGVGKARE